MTDAGGTYGVFIDDVKRWLKVFIIWLFNVLHFQVIKLLVIKDNRCIHVFT